MFRIPAIKIICDEAKVRAKNIGQLKGSIRQGAGNYVGCIFEVAHRILFGGEPSTGNAIYEYDLIMPENWLGQYGVKIDCKSKERTVPILEPEWEASIADNAGKGTEQKCDVYAFGSISVDHSKQPTWIWFAGLISKTEYLEGKGNKNEIQTIELDSRGRQIERWNNLSTGAEFRRKGLPYDENGFICRENCWNRSYKYLDEYRLTDIPKSGRDNLQKILSQSLKEGWGGNRHHLLGKQFTALSRGF